MYPLVNDGTKKFVNYIRQKIVEHPTMSFDARDICGRYTCDVISSCTFGLDAQSFCSEKPEILEHGKKFFHCVNESINSLLPRPMISAEVENFFINLIEQGIDYRQKNNIDSNDFLAHIISMRDSKGVDHIEAIAQGVIYFLDGYETSSIALMYLLFELASNKECQQKLRNEINGATDSNGTIDYSNLIELPFLDQVFFETLRLHPPLAFTTRECSEDIELDGFKGHKYLVKKGSRLLLDFHAIHHDPEHYPNPNEFKPERFDAEHGGVKAFTEASTLMPFGQGPRICLGMKFAQLQVKAMIAETLKNFEIFVDEQTPRQLIMKPAELMNITEQPILLKFKSLK